MSRPRNGRAPRAPAHRRNPEKENRLGDAVAAVHRQMAQLGHLRANVGGITNGFPDRIDAAGIAARDEFGRDELIRNLAFGTPDQVTEKLERYRRLGVDQFTYGASIGLDFAAQKRSFALFIDEVMPAFA